MPATMISWWLALMRLVEYIIKWGATFVKLSVSTWIYNLQLPADRF